MRIGIVGYGAIGRALHHALRETQAIVAGILARESSAEAVRRKAGRAAPVLTNLGDLLAFSPDIIVECAGHAALRDHGVAILEAGTDLLVSSVGALADEALEENLRKAASEGAKLIIPSGALGGLDALGAARWAGLDRVSYVSRKAPSAWKGTRAETLIDLAEVAAPQVFYEGTAREAALDFPQNANVVAAVALAGVGFDRTRVRLMVDPAAKGNRHLLEASGPFGEISATVLAHISQPLSPR